MSVVLTTCGFCSCGCGVYVEQSNGRVAALCPSGNHPVANGRLCVKGWNGIPAVLGTSRLRLPLKRTGDSLQPVSWDEAVSFTASALKRISSDSGPQSVGVIGSAKTTNEECYSLVKFARSILGTSNIDGSSRLYDASIISGLAPALGIPAAQVGLDAVAHAGSMLIVGANVTEQVAHVGSRIETAAAGGCRVVVVDSRTTRLEPYAEQFIRPRAGTDLVWIRALLKTIIDCSSYVEDAPRMPGFEELRLSLNGLSVDAAAGTCGLSGDDVRRTADILASAPPSVVMFGLGVLQQARSTPTVGALADVALLLGGYVLPLRAQNNAQGASDMGLARELLPGYGDIGDAEVREKWESAWACRLPESPGMSSVDMIRACETGDLKALLVFGENLALSAPDTERTLAALDKVEFLAVCDPYLTETARLADVVFPACSFLEKDGTFTNIERRVQRVRKVIEPLGESRPDLEILSSLASALGGNLESSSGKVMAEIAKNVDCYGGVNYEMLEQGWGEPWPLNAASPKLIPVPDAEPTSGQMQDREFVLIASRVNYHHRTGTMSAHSSVLAREYPESYVELCEADAEKLGLRPGAPVRVSTDSASLVRTLVISDSVPAGHVHVPHFFGGDSPNAFAGYEGDPISGVPAFKARPVKVEAVK